MANSKLIKLDNVGTSRNWNYGHPTLVREDRYTSKLPTKTEGFRQKFYENYPALKGLDMRNIVFKGGCILDLLTGQRSKDLDLFLVGLDSEQAAVERVRELLNNFLQIEKDRVELKRQNERERCKQRNVLEEQGSKFDVEIKAIREGPVITVTLSALPIPIQIVLLRYESLEHCLEDDDLGATAIAFDGQQVWLNEKSRFAFKNLTIWADPTKLNATSRKRLEKYFDKGFDIVLPDLDVAKLPRHYQGIPTLCDAVQLPGFGFAYKTIHGNKIFVDHFVHSKENKQDEEEEEKEDTNYRGAYADAGEEKNRASVLRENIFKLCNGQENFSLFAEGDFLLNVLNIWPGIHPRQIHNFYQRFKKQLITGPNFNFVVAKQYFGMFSVPEIAERLLKAKNMDEALEQLTEEHVKRAEEKLQEWLKKGQKDAIVSVPYKDVNECEVFPRLYKESRAFYGDYFKAD